VSALRFERRPFLTAPVYGALAYSPGTRPDFLPILRTNPARGAPETGAISECRADYRRDRTRRVKSARGVAKALNARGVATARGVECGLRFKSDRSGGVAVVGRRKSNEIKDDASPAMRRARAE
jgi:hypothetical protein